MADGAGLLGVSADQVTVERGGRVVINDVSFSFSQGEALRLTGPNGAGKTTLLRAMAGLLPVRDGRLEVHGCDADTEIGDICHYVGHANAIEGEMTVAQNLVFWQRFWAPDQDGRSRLEEALELLGLSGLRDIPARYLSAGQMRRVGLARLHAVIRPVWLLDEPTVSLDAGQVSRFGEMAERHLASGGMIVVATHLALPFITREELQLLPATVAAGIGNCDGMAALPEDRL